MNTTEYYKRLTKASNTINIMSGTGIDHHTITGLMNEAQRRSHLDLLENRAKVIMLEHNAKGVK